MTWKAIRSKGGWVEGFVYLTPNLHSHTGIFIDDPNDDDITALPNTLFGRTYNSALYSTLIWDLGQGIPHRDRGYLPQDRLQGPNRHGEVAQRRIRFPYPVPVGLLVPMSPLSEITYTCGS